MAASSETLLSRLPKVRGKLTPDAPLKDQTWFGVGGPAQILFKPADVQDLAVFLNHTPDDIPVMIIGVASNLLIRDGGIKGVVVKLGPAFAGIETAIDRVTAGAAAMDINIARAAQKAGLSGLEFLSGIPGTIGGALRMNAGAHGGEIKDIVVEVVALDRHGNKRFMTTEEMGFSYRKSEPPEQWIFIQTTLRGSPNNPSLIEEKMRKIQQLRTESQPIKEKTGGSTFANPTNHKAWELIDKAGCRGLHVGGAMISEHHCNFMINTGGATAADLEALGEEVRRRVLETSGVELRWEIRRVGEPLIQ